MPLDLPPRTALNPSDAPKVQVELTKVICGHGGARTTYQFYEDVDAWMGPWGETGYLIGYGKKYNILFMTDEVLQADPVTADWAWKTSIKLQESLRDLLVHWTRTGMIRTATEPQLREAAFDSHPKAYTEAGLAKVAFAAPHLLLAIASIPRAEFLPWSGTFWATVKQVFVAGFLTGIDTPGVVMPHLLPAHTGYGSLGGVWRRAMEEDRRREEHLRQINNGLYEANIEIEQGKYDLLPALDAIIAALEVEEWPDAQTVDHAQRVIATARKRRELVVSKTFEAVKDAPLIEKKMRATFPDEFPR